MFSQLLATSDSRSWFAKTAVQLIQNLGLNDTVDISVTYLLTVLELDIVWENSSDKSCYSDEVKTESFVQLLSEI